MQHPGYVIYFKPLHIMHYALCIAFAATTAICSAESLVVTGEKLAGAPNECGEVSPAYGLTDGLSAGDPLLCTAPSVWTNAACDTAATCVGFKVYTNGVLYVEGDTTSFTYVPPAAAEARLVWQWDVEYRVSVTAGPGGTVSTSGDWLRPGESLAIDAVPDASHEFCRWSDGVDAVLRHGHEAFAICGDGPLEVTAIFGGRLYVDDADGNDATTDGTTPETAFKTIGAAVSAAPSNTVVLVADGTYKPSALVSVAKAVTVRSLSGVAEGVKVDGNAARHCFTLNHPQACLDTITIQNGKSDGSSYDYGVNVRIAANGGQVRNCIVRNGNHANFCTRDNGGGAGIGCVSAQGVVVGCVITNNQFGATSGTQQGAGLYMKAGTVVDSFIGYNKATSRNQNVPGVAGAFLSGSARMANCTVAGNQGITTGGHRCLQRQRPGLQHLHLGQRGERRRRRPRREGRMLLKLRRPLRHQRPVPGVVVVMRRGQPLCTERRLALPRRLRGRPRHPASAPGTWYRIGSRWKAARRPGPRGRSGPRRRRWCSGPRRGRRRVQAFSLPPGRCSRTAASSSSATSALKRA